MKLGELKEKIKDIPDDAYVLIDYEPELDLFDVERVVLTGFDEYNPIVDLRTDKNIWRYIHDK